jgi:serine protease AprX
MRLNGSSTRETRSSASWGKPAKGETRSSALWGKSGRGLALTLLVAVALGAPMAAGAGRSSNPHDLEVRAYLSPGLPEKAQASPNATFDVIIEGSRGETTAEVAADVRSARLSDPGRGVGVRDRFRAISGVAAQLTGRQIVRLAQRPDVRAITSDAPVVLSGYSSEQRWPYVAGFHDLWDEPASKNAPTIAVVDSGIQAGRADFGGRVLGQVNLTSILPNSPGDGRGHGTFVAAIAAGEKLGRTGGSPESPIVSIDVMDDYGMAMTRDVIAAADWILANRHTYNIRVANFSQHSAAPASVFFDPLDRAVERLWFSGVVVVAAAGNYGVDGLPAGVTFAPGNDPFVITVGAADINGSIRAGDDFAAPWSAWGYTLDGFAKPELGAPGRYIIGPVPPTSTLVAERPADVRSFNTMELSGTSFAAPVVAAAAAQVLARHPDWSPDQVKGALMVSAKDTPSATRGSLGVGMVDAARAAAVLDPPNPNAALNQFVVVAGDGSGPAFDAASWANVAQSDASWASASWASASWANASWASASWANASWASASWANASWASASWAGASWASASWASASWADVSWASASWADNADGELGISSELIGRSELIELGIGG